MSWKRHNKKQNSKSMPWESSLMQANLNGKENLLNKFSKEIERCKICKDFIEISSKRYKTKGSNSL